MPVPDRLRFARKRRGLTKTKLAGLVGLTARSVQAFENGEKSPSEETLAALARVLRFPVDFFAGAELDELLPDGVSFRSMSSLTAGRRDAALGAGRLAIEFMGWLGERFTLPATNVPHFAEHEPEAAAEAVREFWKLGQKPISNMVHLLEANGVRVFSLAERTKDVDAFSLWYDGVPYVFLNTFKSAERSRLDAAHELGHLVMHRHGGPDGRQAEHEAQTFAGAFLMPRRDVLAVAPRVPSLPRLVELKKRWSVAAVALIHRLHKVDLLTEWHYRSLCIEAAGLGYRTSEPNGTARESSQLLAKVLAALREDGVGRAEVAKALSVHQSELESLVFGLVPTAVDGEGTERAGGKSRSERALRLVERVPH
ncbi:MAG: helix-turn-helix domain-containing protein [Vicinamibacterales bacterium]